MAAYFQSIKHIVQVPFEKDFESFCQMPLRLRHQRSQKQELFLGEVVLWEFPCRPIQARGESACNQKAAQIGRGGTLGFLPLRLAGLVPNPSLCFPSD